MKDRSNEENNKKKKEKKRIKLKENSKKKAIKEETSRSNPHVMDGSWEEIAKIKKEETLEWIRKRINSRNDLKDKRTKDEN